MKRSKHFSSIWWIAHRNDARRMREFKKDVSDGVYKTLNSDTDVIPQLQSMYQQEEKKVDIDPYEKMQSHYEQSFSVKRRYESKDVDEDLMESLLIKNKSLQNDQVNGFDTFVSDGDQSSISLSVEDD